MPASIDRNEFLFRGPDDFVRLDNRCAELLRSFCEWMQKPAGGGAAPEDAGLLAHAADRYLRDFVVDIQETGPADEDPTLVRQYLANWYIIHTLRPSREEIDRILEALIHLHKFLAREGIVTRDTARAVGELSGQRAFFHDRLEQFWNLTAESIPAWRAVDDYRRRGSSS
jgi:hypothetical protein